MISYLHSWIYWKLKYSQNSKVDRKGIIFLIVTDKKTALEKQSDYYSMATQLTGWSEIEM